MVFLIILVSIIVGIGMLGHVLEIRRMYLQERGKESMSTTLACITAIPAFLFVMADPLGALPARIYFWTLFLGLLWFTLSHERLRHAMAGDNPRSFVSLLTGKLAEMGAWVFAGGVLGVLLLFFMQAVTPADIGMARMLLVRFRALLKLLELGGSATILLMVIVLISQWGFSKRKELLDLAWKHWTRTQKYFKRASLVMTSLFCFSYTASFKGGSLTPLMHKIDLVEQHYRELVWRAEIELSADLRIEAYQREYQSYPRQLQSAIKAEVSAGQRAYHVPAKYLPANFVGYDGRLPPDFQSDGDIILEQYSMLLSEGENSDHPEVPDNVPMRGPLLDESVVQTIEPLHRDVVPDWLTGLPGELAEKIVDRALDVGNISFVQQFSDEFPLIGSLIGTVDGRLNAALTEKIKIAAGYIANRKVRGQIDDFASERGTLVARIPDLQTRDNLQAHLIESHAVARVVAAAQQNANSDLKIAIQKELVAAESNQHEDGQITSMSDKEKLRRENERTADEFTAKYGYDYLLRLRESPGTPYRGGGVVGLAEHELPREYEPPRVVHPEPSLPYRSTIP